MKHRKAAAVLLALLIFVGCGCTSQKTDKIMTVTVAGLGKADAILLTADHHAVMIDCGETSDWPWVQTMLQENAIQKLDLLILTHLDRDHIGGAADLLETFRVDRVIQSCNEEDSPEYLRFLDACRETAIKPEKLTEEITFSFDDMKLRLLPAEKESYKDDNNYSIITEVQYGQRRFLFAGDAEKKRLKEYLKTDPDSFDFLKMPHHGRLEDNTEEFLEAVRPEYAVITCSPEKPADIEVTDLLKKYDVKVCFSYQGTVTAVTDGKNLQVSQKTDG